MVPVHTDRSMPGRESSKAKAGGWACGPAHTKANGTSCLNGDCMWRLHGRRTGNRLEWCVWSYGQAESRHSLPGRTLSKKQQGQTRKQSTWKGRNQIVKTTVLLMLCKAPLVKLQTLPSGKSAHVKLRLLVTRPQCDQGMSIQTAQLGVRKRLQYQFCRASFKSNML